MTFNPGVRRRRLRTVDLLIALALVVIAWVVYEPSADRPFDYVDFPENLRVIKERSGIGDQFLAMARVYGDHGRWSPVNHALFVAQWSWFGSWTPGWQLLRFVLIGAVTILAYSLYRRLRLSHSGAASAASLFVISPAASMGALRLSTAEPVSLLFLVLACHAALRPRRAGARWILAAALLMVMWSKEVLIVAFILPALLALMIRDDGVLGRPQVDFRSIAPLLPSVAILALGSIPILWTWFTAPAGSFASRYGTAGFAPSDLVGGSLAAWLPFAPTANNDTVTLTVLAALLVLVLLGWALALQATDQVTHRRWLLVLALSLPVIGAVAYLPWPFYLLVYALPFMLAGSLLVGQAVSSLLRAHPGARLAGATCLTIVLSFGLSQAANEASRTRALHTAVAQAVTKVATMRDIDSVLVEVAPTQFDSTGNFGPRFRTYAQMLGLDWPNVRDVRCGAAGPPSPRVLHLRLSRMCEPHPTGRPAIAVRHRRFDWPNPVPRTDSVTVTFHSPL